MSSSGETIKSLQAVEVGRTYEGILDEDGRPALALVVTRGRPRALSGDEVIAARALHRLNRPITHIAQELEVSPPAVRTALGLLRSN